MMGLLEGILGGVSDRSEREKELALYKEDLHPGNCMHEDP